MGKKKVEGVEAAAVEAAAEPKKTRDNASIKVKRDLLKELRILAGGQGINEFAATVLQEYVDSNLLKKKKQLEKQKQELEEELKQLDAKLLK